MAEGARGARHRGARRVGRLRARRRPGACVARRGSGCRTARRSRTGWARSAGSRRWSAGPATRVRRASSCMCPAEDGAALWDAVLERGVVAVRARRARHAPARGLLPAARERHHARDRRDLRRARLGVRARHGVHGRRRAAARQGGRARAAARRVHDGGEGDPAAGDADRRRRRGHLGHALAVARRRHRDGVRPRRAGRRPAPSSRSTCAASRRRARVVKKPIYRKEHLVANESYPDDLRYHPEHDWARVEGDEAVLGITWYAQDALGELVHFEAPEAGATVTKDQAYAEVESVKAVSDVIAPLSGEVLEVNQKAVDEPETINEDPYGEGWLVRIRLADAAGRGRRASSTSRPTRRTCRAVEPYEHRRLPLSHRRRPRGDARGDRCRLARRALRADPRGRALRPRARRARRRCRRRRSSATWRSSPRGTPTRRAS